jgi:Putative restriction endonuclease
MVQTPTRIPQTTPPLENGDRLSWPEFDRRYAAMPDGHKAELIEGVVYMAAALRYKSHGRPHARLLTWLGIYEYETIGVEIADNASVYLDSDNGPQPDIALILNTDRGGQTRITDGDYVEGPPELIAEISASTVSIDLGAKKNAYERNGVQEYLVWRVLDEAIDWFILQDGQYVDLLPDEDGITRSRIFPGLWLDRSALIQGDTKRVRAIVNEGLLSNDYFQFIQSLEKPYNV